MCHCLHIDEDVALGGLLSGHTARDEVGIDNNADEVGCVLFVLIVPKLDTNDLGHVDLTSLATIASDGL